MKAVTKKMIISLTGILLIAPFFLLALLVGARAVALSQGVREDLLLVALALGGVAASVINGMGRRAACEKQMDSNHSQASSRSHLHGASVIHLGY
jgi:hypothetical protein